MLELGAGGALTGIVAALNGASKVRIRNSDVYITFILTIDQVVLTDYPDADLIENIRYNVRANISPDFQDRVDVQVRSNSEFLFRKKI